MNKKNQSLVSFFQEIKKQKAQGKEITELNVGDPQVNTPPDVGEAGIQAIIKGKTHYVPPVGESELRKVIADRYTDTGMENVVVSAGGRAVLNGIFGSFLHPGDKVFIPSPYYPSFRDIVEFYGGEPVFLDTSANDFYLAAETVEERIENEGVPRFLIINSPHNPTGRVYPVSELKKIVGLARDRGFGIVFDECYHRFSSASFDMRELCPEAIIVNSCSKTYAMTGWRVGWAVAPVETIQKMSHFFQTVIGSGCSLSQEAAQKALSGDQMIEDFNEQRTELLGWLDRMEIPYPEPEGTFYVFPDFSRFLTGDIKDSFDLAEFLLREAHVGVAPGQAFGDYPSRLRLAYCVSKKDLRKGLQALEKVLG